MGSVVRRVEFDKEGPEAESLPAPPKLRLAESATEAKPAPKDGDAQPVAEQRAPAAEAAPLAEKTAPIVKQEAPPPPAPRKRGIVRKLLLGTVVLAALAAAGVYGHEWYTVGRFFVPTDDAYVKADMSALNAKIAGYVSTVDAPEFTAVKAGDVLLTIDQGDYRLAAQVAHDKIATQKSAIARIETQAKAQEAQIAAQEAQIAMAQAEADNAASVVARQTKLAKSNYASQQTVDDAQTRLTRAQASVSEARQMLVAAEAQADVIKAQAVEAKGVLQELETAATRAERDLSFTQIKAPFDGIVANRAVEPGQYVQPGQRVMALVPSNAAYIDANFKETQLGDIKIGQKADITVDALGSQHIEGTVAAVAPASGAEFSLLPPDNATGNFTKITQRVPVRIRLPADALTAMRPGLSAVVSIDTRTGD